MESQRAIDLSQASGLLFVIPDDLNSECSGFMRFAVGKIAILCPDCWFVRQSYANG